MRQNLPCSLCEKAISHKEKIVAILSGSHLEDEIGMQPNGVLVYHDDCFLEIAGEDFHPSGLKNWEP